MTIKKKEELIAEIVSLLEQVIIVEEESSKPQVSDNTNPTIELLTIKECVKAVSGLSEHTVRQLIAQDKIPYIRTGQGKRGKILVNKSALLKYLNSAA